MLTPRATSDLKLVLLNQIDLAARMFWPTIMSVGRAFPPASQSPNFDRPTRRILRSRLPHVRAAAGRQQLGAPSRELRKGTRCGEAIQIACGGGGGSFL